MSVTDQLACQRLLWAGSKSFAAASLLLPWRVRWPAAAVYAFCRVADDAVDEAPAGVRPLDDLRKRLDAVYSGRPRDAAVDRAFAEVVARHAIPREAPEALFEGFAWDLEGRRYEELADLNRYCARVAATVGVMMTLLMGRRDPETLARACDLGVAMQLTNIARDVGEDASMGRVYLPLEWLRDEGLDPDDFLARPRFSPGLGRVVARLLAAADERYVRADAGIARLPRDCRLAIGSARLIYSAIGNEVAASGYDSVSRRAFTSRTKKLALMARARGYVSRASATGGWPPGEESRFLVEAAGT